MQQLTPSQAFDELLRWCRGQEFSGHDPFDALNSQLFQATPFRNTRLARLAWTQANKRSPFNLRALAAVPRQRNAKGIALFALAALANHRRLKTPATENDASELLDVLLQMQIRGYSGAAWGYNFDWQSRNFFAPKGTPTVVPTAFAVRALLEGYQAVNDQSYLEVAKSSCDFIRADLNVTAESAEEICFSYSPLDQTQIFNASLLAAETLGAVGSLTGDAELSAMATRAARYVVRHQQPDGSWSYGTASEQAWVDNFHTAYVLLSLSRIMGNSKAAGKEFEPALVRGFKFWRESFFLADGWPKYYHDSLYPADAHAAATAIVTLVELQDLDPEALPLAERIASWSISNLRDSRGFFYYQRRRFQTIRTPFMRWTQSWMLYALARLLEAKV
ncbi:MAG TPA: hypothetical protein VJU86_09475 [Pyrinomonadaceae bacterium]|nr:hypothetical protein [Pyrinomonadaceae bacterium]